MRATIFGLVLSLAAAVATAHREDDQVAT